MIHAWKILVWLVLASFTVSMAGCKRGQDAGAGKSGPRSSTTRGDVIRIALVPEQNIYKLHERYKMLAAYLGEKLGKPVEFVTLNTYENVLKDFAEKEVDAAFLGSLVAVLAMDRYGARVVLKPEDADGASTYRGVIIVRADSPAKSLGDLKGKKLAMLRTTYAGALFPIWLGVRGMLEPASEPVYVGTHDEAIRAVETGRADAAAVKDLRWIAYQKAHPESKFRVLEQCDPVPNNALVVSKEEADTLGPRLAAVLLAMNQDPAAQSALETLGAVRFIPCRSEEYAAIYRMVGAIGSAWIKVGAEGPAPSRSPTSRPVGGP